MAAWFGANRWVFDDAAQGDGSGTAQILRGDISAATNATNILTMADHRLATGDKIRLVGGDLPNGLNAGRDYWAIRSDDDDFQVADTPALAVAGTAVTFSDDGTGAQEVTHLPPHNHPVYVDHITVISGATGGAVLIHDALSGQELVDIPNIQVNDAVWWSVMNDVKGIFITTLPATCRVQVYLGRP